VSGPSAGVSEATAVLRPRERAGRRWRLASHGSWYVLGAYVILAIIGPRIVPYNPNALTTGPPLTGPSSQHWFGTDELGRDEFSRVIVAVRVAVVVAVASVGLALAAGGLLGIVAGYARRGVDSVISRSMDVVFAFPELILAIILVAALGPSLLTAIVAIAVVYVPRFARVARTATLSVAGRPYIEAARLASLSDLRIVVRHVVPNIRAPLIVMTALSMSTAQLSYAALSYLGFGARPPEADFGSMLADAQNFVTFAPWLVVFPALALVGLIVALNLFGDSLRDALDPHFDRPS
jgi:peptide/nickel transport system permease protein